MTESRPDCNAASVRQWPDLTPDEMEAKADALVEYGNSLPDGVTTEAFAEASLLRREAREVRSAASVRERALTHCAECGRRFAHPVTEGRARAEWGDAADDEIAYMCGRCVAPEERLDD